MCVTDNQLAIGGKKTVFAVLHTHIEMRAAVAKNRHFSPMSQRKNRVFSALLRVETSRLPLDYFVHATQGELTRFHD
jgi:hypothetical protein